MIEPKELAGMERWLSAMIAKAGRDDPEALAQVIALLDDARTKLPAAAQALREAGYSYADIARPLGIARESAFLRFRPACPHGLRPHNCSECHMEATP